MTKTGISFKWSAGSKDERAELKMQWRLFHRIRMASQRFRYLGEIWRIVRIKTAIPRSLLDGGVGGQQHRDRIANRIVIAYPRKRCAGIADGKDIELSGAEIGDQGIDHRR